MSQVARRRDAGAVADPTAEESADIAPRDCLLTPVAAADGRRWLLTLKPFRLLPNRRDDPDRLPPGRPLPGCCQASTGLRRPDDE
jgi:hypothetical protein